MEALMFGISYVASRSTTKPGKLVRCKKLLQTPQLPLLLIGLAGVGRNKHRRRRSRAQTASGSPFICHRSPRLGCSATQIDCRSQAVTRCAAVALTRRLRLNIGDWGIHHEIVRTAVGKHSGCTNRVCDHYLYRSAVRCAQERNSLVGRGLKRWGNDRQRQAGR